MFRNQRLMRTLLSAAALIALIFALGACSGGDNSVENKNDKYFVVGLEANYPPFNWTQLTDENGAIKIEESGEYAGGYDVSVAKLVAEKLGKELKIVKIEWDGLIPALQSGVIDAIMAGMSPTEERRKTIDFSDNYYRSKYVIVIKKGGKFEGAKSIQDFKGAKLTAQLNTTHYNLIDQIEGADKQIAAMDFASMRVALDSGVIDGYISEEPEALSSTAQNPNFTYIVPEDGFVADEAESSIAVGLRKNDANLKLINEALSEISEDKRNEIMLEAIKNQPSGN